MHSVKIEFCPLDWYSRNPATIVLYVYVFNLLKNSVDQFNPIG